MHGFGLGSRTALGTLHFRLFHAGAGDFDLIQGVGLLASRDVGGLLLDVSRCNRGIAVCWVAGVGQHCGWWWSGGRVSGLGCCAGS